IAARCERGAAREVGAFPRGTDQEGARGRRRPVDDAGVHSVDAEPNRDDAEPDHGGCDRVLRGDEAESPVPERRPERKRGGERAAPEQARSVASPVAGAVVAGDDQTEDEGEGVLPAVQVTGRKELLHRVAEPVAEQCLFPDGPVQLAQDRKGGEVGGEEDGEAPDGAREVTAQRGGRATLEREPRVLDQARRVVWRAHHRVRRPGTKHPERVGGRNAIRLYGIHSLLETPQGRRTSARRAAK